MDYDTLYQHLLQDLGVDACRDLTGNVSVDRKSFAKGALIESFFKKLAPGGKRPALADSRALMEFLNVNQSVGLRQPSEYFDDNLLERFRFEMETLLGARSFDLEDPLDFSFVSIADRIGPGPGRSTSMAVGSFFEKYFQGPLSTSSEYLLALYRAAVFRSPIWAAAEWQRHNEFGEVTVLGSKLFFARKNREKSRVCATEAGVEMMFQKGIGSIIEDRLRECGIDLTTQPGKNAWLALIGSLDDGICTIDLSDASNSVGVDLVQKYVPNPLRGWIMRTRAKKSILPDGTLVDLRMVSTMGNGFTFPLETAIFYCVIRAVAFLKGLPLRFGRDMNAGVFGDDIIAHRSMYPALCRLLYLLGFTVNQGKSFDSGPFRESCGTDALYGTNVRGVYIRSLETPAEIFSAINRLNRWSTTHAVLLKHTIGYLLRWLPYVDAIRYVPRQLSDDAGLHVPGVIVKDTRVCKALFAAVTQKTIREDSPEFLGYNFGLYVSWLQGTARSPECSVTLNIPADVPLDWVTPLNSRERFQKEYTISYRNEGDRKHFFSQPFKPYWWDWPGIVPRDDARRDDSWEAVVRLNLNS